MRNTNNETGKLHKKLDSLQQLKSLGNQQFISTLVQDWADSKPDNDTLQKLRTAWLEMIFYINKLELDRATYSIAYSQLMDKKNKEIDALGELLSKVTDENIDNDDSIPRN